MIGDLLIQTIISPIFLDNWLSLNVLEIHNVNRRNKIEYALAMFLLAFCNMFLAICPLHITF